MVHWALINRVVAWKVRRNGITRIYGSDAIAGLCQSGVEYATADCIEPVRWYLTHIENAQGNAIDIDYESLRLSNTPIPHTDYQQTLDQRTKRLLEARFGEKQRERTTIRQDMDRIYADPAEEIVLSTDTHKLLPVALHYNDGAHTVQLVYETRPDVRAERQDGIERMLGKRLSRIDVKTTRPDGDHLAYRYRFSYKQAASDGRSLLTEIRQESVDAADPADTTVLLRRFEYADHALSDLSFADWTQLRVTGMSLVPDHYDFSDAMKSKAYSSTSMLVNVDADAQPDLIVLNTDCNAEPPHDIPTSDGRGPSGNGPDPRGVEVVDIPKTALSQCKSDHRVYLNTPDGLTGRKFVYDATRSDQLNARLGPLQQVSGGVDFLIVDVDGDGIADLITGDIDNSRDKLGVDNGFYAGGDKGWSGKGEDAPWAATLGGHNPFRELQLADVNGDGKLDLVGDAEYFLNTGAPPFFTPKSAQPLQLYNSAGETKDLPADLPPHHPDAACMSRDDGSRFVELDLGVFRGFSSTAYRGTEDSANLVSPRRFVWRHTSYGDVNGDGIADRVVALSWPESGEIYRDIGSTPIWKDSKGRCGGVNRVYLGNGRGQFYETDMTIGGLYAWPGGPRAATVSRNDVQTAPAVTFEYTPPVNQQAMADLDGDGRAEMIQICGADWAHAIPDKGGAPTGYNLKENSTECPSGALSLPAMWTGSSALLLPFIGTRDDMVQGGYYDVDGNGLADVYVAANPVHPTDSTKAGGAAPYWRRNTLAAPQGRLTAIVGPHGGRTELTWSVVNEGGVKGARIVPVIGAITDADGRTDFKFTSPAFDAGRFIGFRHAEASGTSGVTQSTQFATDRARQGAVDYEAETNEKGFLHHLTVHLDRQDAHKVALDELAPYFNPVYRTCSFEFANASVAKDPTSFVDECAGFDGKEGPRGLPPMTPAGSRARERAAAAPDIDVKPYPAFADNRMRVTEFDWDELSGVLMEERDYNDVATADDTTVSTFSYHPWNNALATNSCTGARRMM